MNLKNAFKVYSNNFYLVWKQLLYTFLVTLFIVLLTFLLVLPIINLLKTSGWFANVQIFIETMYTSPKDLNVLLKNLMAEFYFLILQSFKLYWGNYLAMIFVVVFVSNFFLGVSQYTLGTVINSKLTTLVNRNYTGQLLKTLKYSTRYSLMRILISLPFWLLIVGFVFIYGKLAKGFLLATLLLPLLAIVFVLIMSIKQTILMWYLPALVTNREKQKMGQTDISKTGFRQSFKEICSRFSKAFSSQIVLVLIEFAILSFGGIFTLGVALFIIVPSCTVLSTIYSFVSYYTEHKEKYYLNTATIVTPI